ncbi:MAG: LysM peptidoglycan-binding domain-containing protein [Lachnospiraceae bacterium]|nr:LysM peptidoglycan-binding domain-containing protein [Lachnospiraceae bacterium]
MTIHIVASGDTVNSIAAAYQIPADTIIYNNQLIYPYILVVGQALLLSTPSELQPYRFVVTNGYAYPFINNWVLTQTLPYLSRLSVFSYGFSTEGEIIPPTLDDSFMIQATLEYSSAPFLTLTPFDASGRFNNNLISAVINNPSVKNTLIDNLVITVSEKGFQGVDIDFEYILAEDRIAFADFVRDVRIAINQLGYPVTVALAPKTSDNQPGLLYEGKDYALLGEAADEVLLMTYEWGYTYSEPMAVAPINNVRRVVEYALTRIPHEKINLGIPNYGYDWPLPYEKGVTRATTIGNIEAITIAANNGAEIQFDETAMSPFFTYTNNEIAHEVWFEDVRSMQTKFNLVEEYDLHGMGYWQIMRLFRANWLLLADRFLIDKP